MSKINWSIWLRMPSLTANQAVALSLGIDPSNQAGNRPAINGDRLTLFKACHKTPIAPADLAKWAQSVEWNIPIELAALSQIVPVELVPLPTDAVIQALSEIVAPGVSPETLLAEVLKAGVKFTSDNGESIAVIPDGTLMGHRVGFKHLRGSLPHSVAHLIRGSGASGGGAVQSVGTKPQQSAPATDTAPEQNTATPAPVAGKKWTPEKLAVLKAYREGHTMPETVEKFAISEQRIRQFPRWRPPGMEGGEVQRRY